MRNLKVITLENLDFLEFDGEENDEFRLPDGVEKVNLYCIKNLKKVICPPSVKYFEIETDMEVEGFEEDPELLWQDGTPMIENENLEIIFNSVPLHPTP